MEACCFASPSSAVARRRDEEAVGWDEEAGERYNNIQLGQEYEVYLSFDYESPVDKIPEDATEEQSHYNRLRRLMINRLWKTTVRIVALDAEADSVLLEAKFGNTANDTPLDEHLAFSNSYALGWSQHPNYRVKVFSIFIDVNSPNF